MLTYTQKTKMLFEKKHQIYETCITFILNELMP